MFSLQKIAMGMDPVFSSAKFNNSTVHINATHHAVHDRKNESYLSGYWLNE